MLSPGTLYDSQTHPKDAEPLGEIMSYNDFTKPPERRHSEDDTPYCAFCDTVLNSRPRTGRPRAICGGCAPARKRETDSRHDDKNRIENAARDELTQSWTGLTHHDRQTLIDVIDTVNTAVGRASSHFKAQHRGTWQHQLLVAAKDLVVWRDQHLLEQARDYELDRSPDFDS